MTDLGTNVLLALIYAFLGVVILGLAFVLFDRLTPGSFWHEIIEEHNAALGVMAAGLSIALAIVIAAAIF